MAILCTGSGKGVDRARPPAVTRKASAVFPFPFVHAVGKKRPDHNGSDADDVGYRRDEPGLEIRDTESLDDRRQPKAQAVAGRRGAEIDEAKHENARVLQRLP
jgi:hypothetical protein